ncbi:class I SAM-dependent methyltransferase [Gammaproteobacteria bacterium]|nr:class I SAM-dependent methyltransferase [Gammaproteobacteria bacterium]
MPHSYNDFKLEIRYFFKKRIPKATKILDVGPGAGTYWMALNDLGYKMDCIEIHKPYISEFKLKEKYDNVYEGNILDFDILKYDVIILGDILEHLKTNDAKKLITKISKNNIKCLVAVPYEMEQGEYEGNIYETHLQPDLTPKIMLERYPELKLLIGNDRYGYYINKKR